ncbi:MAG: hypothetical protein WAV20_08115, partial [Blastocatellia bacterium]
DVPAANTGAVTASDNCGTATKSFVGDSPSGSCPKVITRTYRATDACGNSTTCTQTITVADTTAPSISCPASVTVQCDSDVPSADTGSVTASDNCAGTPAKEFVSDSPSGTCPKVITRTYKATDTCGNTATCTQTITVSDTTAPSLTCPPDAVVTCKTDVPAAATTTGELVTQGGSASDNCSGAVGITSLDGEPTDVSSCGENCGGKLVRTYTARDDCGNTSTCTQTITWGTPASAQDAQQLTIASLLKSGDLVVGVPGRSVTIPGGLNAKSSALCIVSKLSASGSASSLPDFGDVRLDSATCQTSPSLDLQGDGTWKNALLSRAISLALNLRFDAQQQQLVKQQPAIGSRASGQRPGAGFELANFALASTLWTQGVLPGPDGLVGTSDDELDSSSARMQIMVPAPVLAALGPNATAADLLRLANAALAGQPTGDVGLSDITAAVDAINRGFDFGRRRLMIISGSQR